jgi:type VI secretion system protein VasG
MGQTAKPPQLDDAERHVENLDIEIAAIRRDMELGLFSDDGTLAQLEEDRRAAEEKRDALHQRWMQESELVERINLLQKQLAEGMEKLRMGKIPHTPGRSEQIEAAEATEGNPVGDPEQIESAEATDSDPDVEDETAVEEEAAFDPDAIRAELESLREQLRELQGEEPLVPLDVDGTVAAQVVADWTGIPIGNMLKDEADILLNIEKLMEERIRGQSHAIKEIADIIRSSKAGVGNPESPIGVFLFVGPSGIGKTECARVLADLLFGGERFMVTINMSEYQESHTVSQLKGAPPGYVGYGEGGVLTEAVRQRPYAVVVLDEVEKAHRDVLNLFYQVFDKGFMRDGEGREIDFKNTVIIMTGNIGWETIFQMCSGGSSVRTNEEMPTPEEVTEAVTPEIQRHFGVALLARCKVVPFLPLDKETMKEIVQIKLSRIGDRLRDSHNMDFGYSQDMVERIAERCTQVEAGARNIDYIIDKTILPDISATLISHLAEETMPDRLMLTLDESGEFVYQFE